MNASSAASPAPRYYGDDKLILGIVLAVVTFVRPKLPSARESRNPALTRAHSAEATVDSSAAHKRST